MAHLFAANVDSIVLGCTHYCLLKNEIRERVKVPVISQDEVIPEKLADYLLRHPEISEKLNQSGKREYHVTDISTGYSRFAAELAGRQIALQKVSIL